MDVLLNRNKSKFKVKKLLIILFWLVLWEVADRVVNNRIILCGPISIISSLINQITKSDFLSICGASFVRIALGFLLSFALGFLLAIAAYKFKLLKEFLEPVMTMLKTVPMVSFVIMLLIWVGNQALDRKSVV